MGKEKNKKDFQKYLTCMLKLHEKGNEKEVVFIFCPAIIMFFCQFCQYWWIKDIFQPKVENAIT